MKLVVTRILKGYNIALIKLPPYTEIEITEFGSPAELELAVLVNDTRTINYCRVANSGASLLFLGFQCMICLNLRIVELLSCREER
ncbi:hypothetical protein [Methanosarcina barkeri]|uniref:hypothetical protein n=1 Tax=Methanosarcina barkeri TaxID=2208 RepID=UPI000A6FA64D|nr:hypothetical protein [Methanosarcina barkeri]